MAAVAMMEHEQGGHQAQEEDEAMAGPQPLEALMVR